jgi:hypothetical protein
MKKQVTVPHFLHHEERDEKRATEEDLNHRDTEGTENQ